MQMLITQDTKDVCLVGCVVMCLVESFANRHVVLSAVSHSQTGNNRQKCQLYCNRLKYELGKIPIA